MLYFVAGYALAVLFPIPFLNSTIISLWAQFGTGILNWIKGAHLPAPAPTQAPTTAPTTARKSK